jgi:hypothetical protein
VRGNTALVRGQFAVLSVPPFVVFSLPSRFCRRLLPPFVVFSSPPFVVRRLLPPRFRRRRSLPSRFCRGACHQHAVE